MTKLNKNRILDNGDSMQLYNGPISSSSSSNNDYDDSHSWNLSSCCYSRVIELYVCIIDGNRKGLKGLAQGHVLSEEQP